MLFIQNKYTKWYYTIVTNAQTRTKPEGYTEKHHIIPKSLGGSNNKDNLAVLTAREHFVCHRLLPKMVVGNNKHKMICAIMRMSVQKNKQQDRHQVSSRQFAIIREEFSISHSNWLKGRYTGDKNPSWKRVVSQEQRDHHSKMMMGKNKGVKQSPEVIAWRTRNHKGSLKPQSSKAIKESWERTREDRIGENHPMFNRKHKRSICEHCSKDFATPMYVRWHGDNCKLNPDK